MTAPPNTIDFNPLVTHDELAAMFASLNRPLPWSLHDEASVMDANGEEVFTADTLSNLPTPEARALAALIVSTVMFSGGFTFPTGKVPANDAGAPS